MPEMANLAYNMYMHMIQSMQQHRQVSVLVFAGTFLTYKTREELSLNGAQISVTWLKAITMYMFSVLYMTINDPVCFYMFDLICFKPQTNQF